MHEDDEKILRLAKEIIIKFIETGRVSPTNFEEQFKSVFWAIKKTLASVHFPEIQELLKSDSRE
jgi:hypothetical protein